MSKLNLDLLAVALLIGGCSEASLYKIDPGPHEVRISGDVTITDPAARRDVALHLLYPRGDGPYPVIVFSHGGFCRPETYDRITAHWASHGYVVIAPHHMDSPHYGRQFDPAEMPSLLPARLRDASFVLDALDDIARRAGFEAGFTGTRRAIAGHSFGAGIASMKSGVAIMTEHWGPWGHPRDDRFEATVLLSAPGGGEELASDPYRGLRKPLMATGGTADIGRGYRRDMAPGDFRRQLFELAPPGDKYSVIIDAADHYLGGLICDPERGGDPDPGAVSIVAGMTTAFFDAYLKDDPEAMKFLASADVAKLSNGRVDYRSR